MGATTGASGRTGAAGAALLAAAAGACMVLAACGPAKEPAPANPPAGQPAGAAAAAAPAPAAPDPGHGFVEVSEAAGIRFFNSFLAGEQGEHFKINLYDHGSGVCVGDFDGDGRDDIYFLNQLGKNALFRNNGDGTFTDVTDAAGVGVGDRVCTSACFADIDNDGDQDLFVASTQGGNLLFLNDGKGHFKDVTEASGLKLVAHTQGCTFFDYDGDGFLDLFITNTAKWTTDVRETGGRYFQGAPNLLNLVKSEPEKCVLYHNNGNGTFTDVTAEAGVGGTGWGGDIAVFDEDGDGRPDLFVTNMFGVNFLYHNDDGKRFTDVTEKVLGRTSWGAVGCRVLDYDADGLLDLLVVDMHSDMWMPSTSRPEDMEPERKFAGPEGPSVERGIMTAKDRDEYRALVLLDDERMKKVVFGNTLFHNLGKGRFEEVSEKAHAETLWPWGVAAADFDLDGREDVFMPTGMGYPYFPWPNSLLMNNGNGTFTERGSKEGITPRAGGAFLKPLIAGRNPAASSRSAAILDYDGDGRPDLVVNNFNERPYLYRNVFPKRHWAALRLRGTRCNRDAIGALVRIESGKSVQVRQVCSAGGYLAQSSRILYFGLGDDAKIDRCEVTWPGGKPVQVAGLKADCLTDLVEPDK